MGFYIIEDDYDHEFHYDSRPMPPLASLPHSELVIHVGSLSKVFAPGIRLVTSWQLQLSFKPLLKIFY